MPSTNIIPLFPLGLVLLPQMPLPLHIFEERYKLMIGECLEKKKEFGIVYFNGTDIQAIGCTASIQKVLKRYDDGRLDILTQGENRFEIKEMTTTNRIWRRPLAFLMIDRKKMQQPVKSWPMRE